MGSRENRRRRSSGTISKEALLGYIREQPGLTVGFSQVLRDFDADRTDRRQIRDILDELVRDGRLTRHKGHRYEAQPETRLYEGRVHLHPDGYAFVTPLTPVAGVQGDVFIPPHATGTAMDGDTVSFTVVSREKAEGLIVKVDQRAHIRAVGQLRFDGRSWFLSPADRKLPEKILVEGNVSEHKDKIVEIELTRFPSEGRWPSGKIVSVIGFIDDPNIETSVIMRKYGLDDKFPEAVEEEAVAQSVTPEPVELERRSDFRGRHTITIDPATARDFDDAVDVEVLPDGGFRVGVHVADVAHFVQRGSCTDVEARERGCSVYFPDRVVPMLPERVSNDVCSLNAGTDRLAMSVLLEVGPGGDIRSSEFHQSVILSRARMSYETVQRILDGDAMSRADHADLVDDIETLGRVARLLEAGRRDRGTIDFDLPEPELTYDEEGLFVGVARSERYFSHRLIEEFMIAANEAVARMLEARLKAMVFRIHEPPDAERIGELSETLGRLGLRFYPKERRPKEFQQFLSSVEGRPDARMISYLVLRSFRQAVYSTKNQGHFGLASRTYTHFTSPIRRYPDLVVHRLLKAWMLGEPSGYTPGELEAIAAESSARERLADQAERDLFEWKRMILLEERLGDTLDAIIIHVFPKGIRIELVDHFIEGQIDVEDIVDDYYDYNARGRALVGRHTRRRYELGQRIRVQVARIDKLMGRAYFMLV